MSLFAVAVPTLLGGLLALLIIIGVIAAKLYTRSSQERAFVRTGLGGKKVVMSGGAMVLPIFHEIIWVNRNTLRLPVDRDKEQSLITKDKLRVDVSAEFYVRVASADESVAIAAQTLGAKTEDKDALKELVEGKFVDALRSAAASMTMEQLHAQRAEFVQNVKSAVSEDLAENGLELESVSLTGLNQTSREHFDENNAFDAEGLLRLTQEIETRKKLRNDIEQDNKVAIAAKDLTATQQTLELTRQRETATLNTDRDIAAATAATQAEIAQTAAEGRRRAEEANLEANQKIATKQVETERSVKTAKVEADTAVQLRTQETGIQVANKSKDVASAEAEASQARAKAVAAEEQVETARAKEIAERSKVVTLVKAEEKAGEEATAVTMAAQADRTAAEHRAEAARVIATGERDADVLRGEGAKALGAGEAEALRAKNEAQNLLSADLIAQQVKLALVQNLPAIIEQSVKPLLSIESIRIAEVGGLNGNGGGNGAVSGGTAGGNGGLGNEVVNAALKYRMGQPVVDAILSEVGLREGGDMSKLMHSAASMAGIGLAGAEGGETAGATPETQPA